MTRKPKNDTAEKPIKAAKPKDKLWDIVGAISHTKDTSILTDSEFEKSYNPWVINRAFSHHKDSILAANILNDRPILNVKDGYDAVPGLTLQFLFLLNTLRARKRYSSWLKFTDSDDVQAVAEYYGTSVRHARGLVTLHTSDQLAIIRSRLDQGGTSKGPRHDTARQSSATCGDGNT